MADMAIRALKPEEVELAVEWAAREGWNPGLDDAQCFAAEDPEAFLLAEVDGQPAACISVVRYGETFGFLGFYIAAPEFRGRGIGLQVWNAGMARLADRLVGLDGVVDQQPNYRKSGFVLAHRNIRHGGRVATDMPEDPRVVAVNQSIIGAVTEYDVPFFPAPRERFLTCWLSGASRIGRALIEDGVVRGYGVIRPCRSGFKVGPLFAEDEAGADLLFRSLAAEAGDDEVFLDTPAPNGPAVALAVRYGLEPVFETARMYRGQDPALPLERIFGITTFELG